MPTFEVVDSCNDGEWREREFYWISYYKDKGYDLKNISNGGIGVGSVCEETKKKISKSLKGRKPSENSLKKTRKAVCQYDLDGEYIKTFQSISDAQRGMGIRYGIRSAILRTQSSAGYQWRYMNENYLLNVGKYNRNKSNPLIASKSRMRLVEKIDKYGNVIEVFSSIKEAEAKLNISNVSAVCNGARSNSMGQYFRYKIQSK